MGTEDGSGDGNDDGIPEDNEFEAKNRKVGQDLRYKQIKNRSWGSSPTINNSWEWKCKGQFGRRRKRETFNNKFDLFCEEHSRFSMMHMNQDTLPAACQSCVWEGYNCVRC